MIVVLLPLLLLAEIGFGSAASTYATLEQLTPAVTCPLTVEYGGLSVRGSKGGEMVCKLYYTNSTHGPNGGRGGAVHVTNTPHSYIHVDEFAPDSPFSLFFFLQVREPGAVVEIKSEGLAADNIPVLRLVVGLEEDDSLFSLSLQYLGIEILSVDSALRKGHWYHIGMDHDENMHTFQLWVKGRVAETGTLTDSHKTTVLRSRVNTLRVELGRGIVGKLSCVTMYPNVLKDEHGEDVMNECFDYLCRAGDTPCLKHVFPLVGPFLGYTPVRLTFTNLNPSEHSVRVFMDYKEVKTALSTVNAHVIIEFNTTAGESGNTVPIRIYMNDVYLPYDLWYSYSKSLASILKIGPDSIFRGGDIITVTGDDLEYAQDTTAELTWEGGGRDIDCKEQLGKLSCVVESLWDEETVDEQNKVNVTVRPYPKVENEAVEVKYNNATGKSTTGLEEDNPFKTGINKVIYNHAENKNKPVLRFESEEGQVISKEYVERMGQAFWIGSDEVTGEKCIVDPKPDNDTKYLDCTLDLKHVETSDAELDIMVILQGTGNDKGKQLHVGTLRYMQFASWSNPYFLIPAVLHALLAGVYTVIPVGYVLYRLLKVCYYALLALGRLIAAAWRRFKLRCQQCWKDFKARCQESWKRSRESCQGSWRNCMACCGMINQRFDDWCRGVDRVGQGGGGGPEREAEREDQKAEPSPHDPNADAQSESDVDIPLSDSDLDVNPVEESDREPTPESPTRDQEIVANFSDDEYDDDAYQPWRHY